ncbi:transporter substrate-binding domain-containing protein [Azospirillum sp. SYSU D00513]|uniref:transporter substrate-binding domain-containing protein n=1 Tax=Azospirillum sp. SYSU D00513 TaxID=2812561 RepID=UPI001A970409|nr:transporter substrate-binding domain-containing protein [Azospirillum sp. SYSU D00513]
MSLSSRYRPCSGRLACLAAAFFLPLLPATAGAAVLDDVRARGTLTCGVMAPGTGVQSDLGPRGFFMDFCRGVAAAVLGSPKAVTFAELEASQWFEAVHHGDVDVLMAPATRTMKRDAEPGVQFAATYFHGGPAVIAHRHLGYAALRDVRQARVCVQEGTTSQDWLAGQIAVAGGSLDPMTFRSGEGRWQAFMQRQCDLMVSDRLFLQVGARQRGVEENYVVFPDRMAVEPQGPVVRADDPVWRNIVAWTVHVTLLAEQMGVTSQNLEGRPNQASRDRDWLLGVTPGVGEPVGLDDLWAGRLLRTVGNYGEIFARNLTVPFGIARGENALWSDGGLMAPPSLR